MTTRPSGTRPRPLFPREHGAWGQLVLPLLCGLLLARPSGRAVPAAVLLAAAVVLAFIAHEPLLVVLGHRGERARESDGRRAARRLGAVLALAAVAGAAGLWLAPLAARLALVLPLALAGLVAWLVRLRLEKTVAGEVAVAAALCSAAAVVALAGGAAPRAATAALCAWVISFAAATLSVHAVLGRARSRGGAARRAALPHAAGAVFLGALALLLAAGPFGLSPGLPLAAAPTVLLSTAVCLAPVSPRRLRPLGWAFVATSVAALAVLVVGLR